MTAMLDALQLLDARLVAADAIGQALDLAGGDSAPGWVYMYRDQLRGIQEASEALEVLIRRSGH